MKYDGLIFGNGLTLNLLFQIREKVPEEKRYLLSIDEFMKYFYESRLSPREDGIVFRSFYKNKEQLNLKYYLTIKEIFREYYQRHNGNIEYHFGTIIFEEEKADYDLGTIKDLFPAFYNVWYCILSEYLSYLKLKPYVDSFYSSVYDIIDVQTNIWTTNFDKFADSIIPVRHLHGKFIDRITKYNDIVLYMKNEKEFSFKYIWGHNGYGKMEFIKEYYKKTGYEEYFDFSFFMNENIEIKNLLVYGLGFQKSGWAEVLRDYKDIYKKPFFGGIIDEHILIRIQCLQKNLKIENVTMSYYKDEEKGYFTELIECLNLHNIKLKHVSEFDFGIEKYQNKLK
jgi:hypothetical protein